jgi:zinc D-Ala-D-Ala carboxypeptidase
MNLSAHFTLEELTASQWAARMGVPNVPTPEALARLQNTAARMEEVRTLLGDRAIIISSGYRSIRVNAAVGGAITSAHVTGDAVDFICPSFGTPYEVAKFIAAARDDLRFDQLIYEFQEWVHISFDARLREQLLTIRERTEGYLRGIINVEELPR